MATYKIVWKCYYYGESVVEANSPEEAKLKAKDGQATDWEELDPSEDWEIDSVTLVPL